MIIEIAVWGLLAAAGLALLYAVFQSAWIFRQEQGTDKLQKISSYVSKGAMTFLLREYRILLPFILVLTILLFIVNQGINKFQALAFLLGSVSSAGAGFIGMKVAVAANSRTTAAAARGLNPALRMAFSGGSVMGMSVVGLALLGLFTMFFILKAVLGLNANLFQNQFLPIITGFSLGASAIALFARVGGGIYTKAADIGADLVGKVEVGIPEDDPRNPATIADNVGDNVGDVAGMGADLFESFVGTIIGALILGFSMPVSDELRFKIASIPLLMVALGCISSIIGVFFVRVKEGKSPQRALNTGTMVSAVIVLILLYPVIRYLFNGTDNLMVVRPLFIYLAAVLGLAAGLVIGLITEHYTGFGTKPVKEIVKASTTGSATNIITGVSVGMFSCLFPIITIVLTIGLSYVLAGMFGIAIAALGMLVTIGIQLAVDAYGPIADNAGGLAVMCEYPPEVRKITDTLDSVGNTTAAIGKGFAIGSAALTALILFSSFKAASGIEVIDLTSVHVLIGIMVGAVIPYIFSSMTIGAIGRAALKMIEEVRRQFQSMPGILTNQSEPDHNKCIEISTIAALREMLLPGIAAVVIPVLVGFLGGVEMLSGLLVGATVNGVTLAIFMSNSGGAWDNAKKMIEDGLSGGRGSEAHKAAVVGDTVGDPFKDTAGPSLNILIKLMAIISLIIAPFLR